MCLGPEFRPVAMSAMQSSVGLGSVPIIQPVHHINLGKICFNFHGDFFESGIRACPESVGVGKFCRLRLRLRAKQPTPTDSDSDSDSDSAALVVLSVKSERAVVQLCGRKVGCCRNQVNRILLHVTQLTSSHLRVGRRQIHHQSSS